MMISASEELHDELEVISSIYGPRTLQRSNESDQHVYELAIPQSSVTLRIVFPDEYPAKPPNFVGIQSLGENLRKGAATRVLGRAEEALARVYIPGSVCLFDLLQELEQTISSEETLDGESSLARAQMDASVEKHNPAEITRSVGSTKENMEHSYICSPPVWTISEPLTVKKSVFVARACAVHSPAEAQAAVSHLIAVDKKVAKAEHNITAYRIRAPPTSSSSGRHPSQHQQLVFQDCDDDGETAAGGRLLHLLQIMDVWGLQVVVSRWYGGVKLGPDRFRCISEVAREAIVKGGWTKGDGK